MRSAAHAWRAILPAVLLLSTSSFGQTPAPTPPAAPKAESSRLNPVEEVQGHVVELTYIAEDRRSFTAADASGHTFAVKVRAADQVERLKAFKTHDVAHVWLASDESDLFLRQIEAVPIQSSRSERAFVLVVSFVVLLTITALLYRGKLGSLVVGADGRYSKSKFQMAVWFATLFATYCTAVYLRATHSHGLTWGGVDIPQNLLLISGLSALSFAGAKGITSSAVSRGLAVSKATPAQQPARFPSDLLYGDDGKPDFGDFQMLVVTALATVVYLGSVIAYFGQMPLSATVTLPDVDTTILSVFGIGQGAYLAKKALSAT